MRKKYLKIWLTVILISALSVACMQAQEVKPAPDFKLRDLKDNTFVLSSYKDRQPVILFFWTTWCPFCRRELKILNDKYPELVKNSLEAFAINIEEPVYKVENFIKVYNLKFKVLLDTDADVAQAYGVVGIPTYVIVDKKENIVFQDNYFPDSYNALVSQ